MTGIIICAYCGRDITKRGTRRTNHEGRAVCRLSCSWQPIIIPEPPERRDAR